MLRVVFLFALTAAVIAEIIPHHGSNYNLTLTSQIDDYILLSKRQFLADITTIENRLMEFEDNYKQTLNTIAIHKELMADQIDQAEKKLNPMEAINDLSKHCVQKYRNRIISHNSIVMATSNCIDTGSESISKIITPLQSILDVLTYYHNSELPNYLEKCSGPDVDLNLCTIETINDAVNNSNNHVREFKNKMKESTCQGEYHIREVIGCCFNIVHRVTTSIARVMYSIERCIEGKEFCPPCEANGVDESSTAIYLVK